MKKSLLFQAIFGNDEIRPPGREPKLLSVEDRPWDLRPARVKDDRQQSADDLVAKIFGRDDTTSKKIVKPVPPPAVPAAVSITELLNDLLKRVAYVRRSGPPRKATIKRIVDVGRNSAVCKPIKNDEGWNKLSAAVENYVASAIIAQ